MIVDIFLWVVGAILVLATLPGTIELLLVTVGAILASCRKVLARKDRQGE